MNEGNNTDTRPRSSAYDALKGIGILVIVWGHNTLLSSALPELRSFFYSFNVHLFFILSLLLSSRAFSKELCLNRLVRYGVPYVFFVTLGWVIMFGLEGSDGVFNELISLLNAYVFGTSHYTKEASGLFLFWFLPSLFSLSLIHSLTIRYKQLYVPVLVCSWSFVLLVGLLPQSILNHGVLGLFPALWIFAVGQTAVFCSKRKLMASRLGNILCFGFTFIGIWLIWSEWIDTGQLHMFAGYTILAPLDYIFIIGLPISVTLNLLNLGQFLARSTFLVKVGCHSLVIYLCHQFIFRGIELIARKAGLSSFEALGNNTELVIVYGLLSFLATLCGCWIVIICLKRLPWVERFIFPVNLETWPIAKGVSCFYKSRFRSS